MICAGDGVRPEMSVLLELIVSIGEIVAGAWATPSRKLWLLGFAVGIASIVIATLLWGS